MARPPTPVQNEYPMAVSARSNNREWFNIPLEICWRIFIEKVDLTVQRYSFQTHAFILMSNHFHWLLSTPLCNLAEGMGFFMTETSRAIARAGQRINRIYGGRYKPVIIDSPIYYANTLRYFYQNPIRAGVVQSVRDYAWSSFARPNDFKLTPCIGFDDLLPKGPFALECWLNVLPPSAFDECVKKALRRRKFQFPHHPTKKTPIKGDEYL